MLIPDLSPLWLSLRISLLATVITFALGITIAYKIHQSKNRWRSIFDGLLLLPLVLPPTVIGFVLLVLLGRNGAIGQLLIQLQIRLVFTWYAAVITAIVVAFPLMYRAALGAFEQIDPLVIDAAKIDGASEIEIFWTIALPLSIPGILAGTILSFGRSLGEFGATLMLAGNIPGQTQTIPMAIYFAVEAGDMQSGWFWSIAIVLLSFTGIMILNVWKPKK